MSVFCTTLPTWQISLLLCLILPNLVSFGTNNAYATIIHNDDTMIFTTPVHITGGFDTGNCELSHEPTNQYLSQSEAFLNRYGYEKYYRNPDCAHNHDKDRWVGIPTIFNVSASSCMGQLFSISGTLYLHRGRTCAFTGESDSLYAGLEYFDPFQADWLYRDFSEPNSYNHVRKLDGTTIIPRTSSTFMHRYQSTELFVFGGIYMSDVSGRLENYPSMWRFDVSTRQWDERASPFDIFRVLDYVPSAVCTYYDCYLHSSRQLVDGGRNKFVRYRIDLDRWEVPVYSPGSHPTPHIYNHELLYIPNTNSLLTLLGTNIAEQTEQTLYSYSLPLWDSSSKASSFESWDAFYTDGDNPIPTLSPKQMYSVVYGGSVYSYLGANDFFKLSGKTWSRIYLDGLDEFNYHSMARPAVIGSNMVLLGGVSTEERNTKYMVSLPLC